MRKELITHEDPKSPVSEMFRTLRTNIQFMNTDERIETILITSTLPGEGKSWVSSNLAVTFAQTGKKVIIIDADMRKGRQYNIFKVSPRPGLSNYLSGVVNGEKLNVTKDLEMFIKKTDVENLYVMPAGNVPPNPSELLVSKKMEKLLKELKEMFDVIIFDGTPSLLVADAIILSRIVDTTIIVTAYKETKMDNLDKVKKTIENVGGNIAGVILNKIPISSKKYEDTYYYGNSSSKSFDIKNIEKHQERPHKTKQNNINSDKIVTDKSLDKKVNKKIEKDNEDIETQVQTEEVKTIEYEPIKEIKKTKKVEKTIENTVENSVKNIEEPKPISAPRKRNSILNDIENEDEVGIRVTDEELELKAKNRSRDILQQINRYMKEK
mgnify:CR=1 FL=1